MNSENRAKIREALGDLRNELGKVGLFGREMLARASYEIIERALLDAEDKPSVPMEMLIDLANMHIAIERGEEHEDNSVFEIAARYGYAVKEIDDGL